MGSKPLLHAEFFKKKYHESDPFTRCVNRIKLKEKRNYVLIAQLLSLLTLLDVTTNQHCKCTFSLFYVP